MGDFLYRVIYFVLMTRAKQYLLALLSLGLFLCIVPILRSTTTTWHVFVLSLAFMWGGVWSIVAKEPRTFTRMVGDNLANTLIFGLIAVLLSLVPDPLYNTEFVAGIAIVQVLFGAFLYVITGLSIAGLLPLGLSKD